MKYNYMHSNASYLNAAKSVGYGVKVHLTNIVDIIVDVSKCRTYPSNAFGSTGPRTIGPLHNGKPLTGWVGTASGSCLF